MSDQVIWNRKNQKPEMPSDYRNNILMLLRDGDIIAGVYNSIHNEWLGCNGAVHAVINPQMVAGWVYISTFFDLDIS